MFYENVKIKREEKRIIVECDVKVNDDDGLSDVFVFELNKEEDVKNLKELLFDVINDLVV